MKKRQFWAMWVALTLTLVVSCSGDSDDGVRPEPSPYKNLTQKDHVLFNLGLAYTNRNLLEFGKLLDEGFMFDQIVEWWDRATEMAVTANMFDENFSKPGLNPITEISVTLVYEEGDDNWHPVVPDDQDTYPGETWYMKTVIYDITFTAGSTIFVGRNIQAAFVTRQSLVGMKTVWRIVSWEDDTDYLLAQTTDGITLNRLTEETTWGKFKSLYSN